MRSVNSSRYALLPIIILGVVIVALAIGGVALYYIQQVMVDEAGASLALAAADIADKLDRILYERYGDIKVMARMSVIRTGDSAGLSRVIAAFKENSRFYLWLGVTDAQGRIVAATNPGSLGKDRSQRDWFKAVRDRGEIHILDVQPSEDAGNVSAVTFTAPIHGPRGEFLGAVSARVSLHAMEDVIRETVNALQVQEGASREIEYHFLDRDGEVIADSRLREEGKVNLKYLALLSALLSASAMPGYVEEMHVRRKVPVVTGYASCKGYADFAGLHWAVLVREDRDDILASSRTLLWKLGLTGAMVLSPMLGFLLWTTGRLRAEWAHAREETIRATAAEANLRESEQRYRNLVDYANDIIYRTDGEGRFVFFNPTAVRLLKYSSEELHQRNYLDLIRPDYRDIAERFYGRQFVRKTSSTYFEMPVLAKGGGELWIGQNAQVIVENGRFEGFHAVARDITERKKAEDALLRKNAELSQALQEIKILRGFIPICAWCKKIRDDSGYWQQLEKYIEQRSDASFSHGVCPECYQKVSETYFKKKNDDLPAS